MIAKEIAALVSMPKLLRELGFDVNERTHRCCCSLHGGKNRSSFSWNENGEWFCFTQCGGGDRIALVMRHARCDFKAALRYLAALAGVDIKETAKFKDELAKARRERRQREIAQSRIKAAEREALLQIRDNVLRLEQLRRNAAHRLGELNLWGRDRFPGEEDAAWAALQLAANQMPHAAAAYTVISCGSSEIRADFALHPDRRACLIDRCIENGGVVNDKGSFVEFVL